MSTSSVKRYDRSAAEAWLETAGILREALPYMRRYAEQHVVIKLGGHAMHDPKLLEAFAADIVLLRQVGIYPILVHGGGPQIQSLLDQLGIQTPFVNGLRVTSPAAMQVVEMVLSGQVNKQIVSAIQKAGGQAVGISGKDANLLRARRIGHLSSDNPEQDDPERQDLGLVGEPELVNPVVLAALETAGLIPVIAPLAYSQDAETLNVNGDAVAGALAVALGAKRLLLLSDVPGVLDKEGELLTSLSLDAARQALSDGTAQGGMKPKLKTAIDAVEQGVEATVIMDGRIQHRILLELFTDLGAGTFVQQEAWA